MHIYIYLPRAFLYKLKNKDYNITYFSQKLNINSYYIFYIFTILLI